MTMFASKLTRFELDAAHDISLGTIRIMGIIVANGSANDHDIVFTNAAGVDILTISVDAQNSVEFSAHWLADKGLSVGSVSEALVVVTVAHGAEGS